MVQDDCNERPLFRKKGGWLIAPPKRAAQNDRPVAVLTHAIECRPAAGGRQKKFLSHLALLREIGNRGIVGRALRNVYAHYGKIAAHWDRSVVGEPRTADPSTAATDVRQRPARAFPTGQRRVCIWRARGFHSALLRLRHDAQAYPLLAAG